MNRLLKQLSHPLLGGRQRAYTIPDARIRAVYLDACLHPSISIKICTIILSRRDVAAAVLIRQNADRRLLSASGRRR